VQTVVVWLNFSQAYLLLVTECHQIFRNISGNRFLSHVFPKHRFTLSQLSQLRLQAGQTDNASAFNYLNWLESIGAREEAEVPVLACWLPGYNSIPLNAGFSAR